MSFRREPNSKRQYTFDTLLLAVSEVAFFQVSTSGWPSFDGSVNMCEVTSHIARTHQLLDHPQPTHQRSHVHSTAIHWPRR